MYDLRRLRRLVVRRRDKTDGVVGWDCGVWGVIVIVWYDVVC